LTEVEAAIKGPPTMATGNVRYAREDARDHDGDMLSKGISRELGNKSYRWEDSYGSGTSLLGKGAFGTVLREPNKGNAIKRGEIGQIEADLIDRLGKVDLGPKLLAAQLDGDSPYNKGTKIGRVAMGVVAGSPIGRKAPDKEIGGVKIADAYWIARANLHRLGIAHNDMHIDNVLVDRKGKARFVDLGLAQDSPKAALAEAMGAFMKPQGAMVSRDGEAKGDGDWQVRRWSGTGGEILNNLEMSVYRGTGMQKSFQKELEQRAPVLARIRDNKAAVVFEMKRDGFTLDDVATIIDHGIRSPLGSYERGSWGKMSNEQAQKYINLLYEGIE
jgi:serine/threonine protein kinase